MYAESPHVYESINLGQQVPGPEPTPAIGTSETDDYYKVPRPSHEGPQVSNEVKLRQKPPLLKSTSEPAGMSGTSNRPKYASIERGRLTPTNVYSTVDTGDNNPDSKAGAESLPRSAPVRPGEVKGARERRRWWAVHKALTSGDWISIIVALVALLVAIAALIVSSTGVAQDCDCSSDSQEPFRIDELDSRLNSTEHEVAQLVENGLMAINGCETSTVSSCNLSYSDSNTPPTYTLCETSPVAVYRPGYYTKGMQCGISDLGGQINPVVSTLLLDEQEKQVWCSCYLIVPSQDTATGPESNVICSLFVTRCASETG